MRWFILFVVVLLSFGAGGCAKENEPQAAAGPASSNAAGQPAALMGELETVVKNCTISVEDGVISRCQAEENRSLIRDFSKDKRNRLEALPTLVSALEASDERLRAVASRLLEGAYQKSFGDVRTGAVNEQLASRMLLALPKLRLRQAQQVAAATVHAAVLAGQHRALFETLDKLADEQVKLAAIRHVLTHGGSEAMKRVEQLAAGEDAALAASALFAARAYRGDDPEIRTRICALAKTTIGAPDAASSEQAAELLARCGRDGIDALLGDLERRSRAGNVGVAHLRPFHALCKGTPVSVPAEQCSRWRQVLEATIENATNPTDARAAALFQLALQFPDEDSEKLCVGFENDAEPRIQAAAKEAHARISASKAASQP